MIVYQDWITRCTGCRKRISDPDKEAAKTLKAKPEEMAGTWGASVLLDQRGLTTETAWFCAEKSRPAHRRR